MRALSSARDLASKRGDRAGSRRTATTSSSRRLRLRVRAARKRPLAPGDSGAEGEVASQRPPGHTDAPEFGYTTFTKNLLLGAVRNLWNIERTPFVGRGSEQAEPRRAQGALVTMRSEPGAGKIRLAETLW